MQPRWISAVLQHRVALDDLLGRGRGRRGPDTARGVPQLPLMAARRGAHATLAGGIPPDGSAVSPSCGSPCLTPSVRDQADASATSCSVAATRAPPSTSPLRPRDGRARQRRVWASDHAGVVADLAPDPIRRQTRTGRATRRASDPRGPCRGGRRAIACRRVAGSPSAPTALPLRLRRGRGESPG